MLTKLFTTLALAMFATSALAVTETQTFNNTTITAVGGDTCGNADICANRLDYTSPNLSFSVAAGFGTSQREVILDLAPANGGFGVNNRNGDEVNQGDWLTFTFDRAVTLDTVVFNNKDHGTSFNRNAKFDLWVDGVSFQDLTLSHFVNLNKTGTVFTFMNNLGGRHDDFYIGGTTATFTAAVPEPETYAMLLAGLGMIGALARRRRIS